jgi:hypothetical protein
MKIVRMALWVSSLLAAAACGSPTGTETGGSQSSAIEIPPEPPAYPCRFVDGSPLCPGFDAGSPPPVCDPPCERPLTWCALQEGRPVCRVPPPRPMTSTAR